MMILSNCLYVRAQVVPRLLDCFRSHGYPPSKEVENVCCMIIWNSFFHYTSLLKYLLPYLYPYILYCRLCIIRWYWKT